jgi:SEC-C motif-containing protein
MLCPCHSKQSYRECCKPFHNGTAFPSTALQLMRSRYSAYALKKFDYILATAHPDSPYKRDLNDIRTSYQSTLFEDLEILEFIDGDVLAYVTFRAVLTQDGKDISFTEKSLFEKINHRWYYHSGERIND